MHICQIDNETVQLSRFGEIVCQLWSSLPTRWVGVDLDEFVVMPNHLHGIVLLGQGGPALPQLISRFKSFSTRIVRALPGESDTRLWQRGYHEHVIRHDQGLSGIREYIANNPPKWHLDRENPANIAHVARRAGREAGPYK
jgi:REP element-mobilizing transposase RayT